MVGPVDTTVIPPPDILDAAIQPWSLPSLGSALVDGPFCPECDRDLTVESSPVTLVLCETCVDLV
jgi:hypothetical protein